MTKEALTLALKCAERCEAIDGMYSWSATITAIKEALAQPEQEKERCVGCEACIDTACGRDECPKGWPKAAQPEQKPVAWKLVPIKPTDEMLKAMDECSKEGYDERLYAGHAASVYMAAVDVAPTPPQRKPLSDDEIILIVAECASSHQHTDIHFARAIEAAHGIKGLV